MVEIYTTFMSGDVGGRKDGGNEGDNGEVGGGNVRGNADGF